MKNKINKIAMAVSKSLFLSTLCLSSKLFAVTLPLPSVGDVVGEVTTVTALSGESLGEVGRRFDIGFDAMLHANPTIDPSERLFSGTKVVIPGQFILPSGERRGVVINLAELRLYYYPKNSNVVITEPVGIGREGGWKTPTGKTHITAKREDPVWRPTANVRAEAARNGTPIPNFFPAGPNNPLGKHMLRLAWPTYLIHGTNRPDGVGSRVSAGCIRMFPEGIKTLFDNVRVGTRVRVVNEPFKAGWKYGRLYFEAHKPLKEQRSKYQSDLSAVVKVIHEKLGEEPVSVHWLSVKQATEKADGIPIVIA